MCPRQILLFVEGASGILTQGKFQRIAKIYQGFWITKILFHIFCI